MFRECYFEYAGKSSQDYNLMLCYVGDAPDSFNSGGEFDPKTDTLPRSNEILLYDKDYSSNPLEFEVEFISTHGIIPQPQMTEIKNWLFGQNGWKTFRCMDDRQDYQLKCIFLPGEDIVGNGGYRGLRCTLKNVSPFWYGTPVVCEFDDAALSAHSLTSGGIKYSACQIEINDDIAVDEVIFPTIEIKASSNNTHSSYQIHGSRTVATSVDDALAKSGSSFIRGDESNFIFNILFANSDNVDTITVNTRYGSVVSEKSNSCKPEVSDPPIPLFRLYPGINVCRFWWQNSAVTISSIKVTYTPQYRMGAF